METEKAEVYMDTNEDYTVRLLPKGLIVNALGVYNKPNIEMAQKIHDALSKFLERHGYVVISVDGELDFAKIKIT